MYPAPVFRSWKDSDCVACVSRRVASTGLHVLAGGVFDLFHAGHAHTIAWGRQSPSLSDYGVRLTVLHNSDRSARAAKGEGRPCVPFAGRAAVLAALRWVDAVVGFDEDTPEDVIAWLAARSKVVLLKGHEFLERRQPLPGENVVVKNHGFVLIAPPSVFDHTADLVGRLKS